MVDKKNILSIDSDDDNNNYDEFLKHLNDDVERRKNKTHLDIEEMGETYLLEIDEKKRLKEPIKNEYIEYILKNSSRQYTENKLKSYSFEDVKNIYEELKAEKLSLIGRFFNFLYQLFV